MGIIKLGLEGQEQDLEIDALMNDGDERLDDINDSPFSPMASRAFATATDGAESLERMNTALTDVEIDDIPESSRLVMETAMESIRSKLLGHRARNVSVEGFKDINSLKVAIEENKGIIQRVWDAIVKFFKGIGDWIGGFFKKKETDVKVIEVKIVKVDVAAKKLAAVNLSDKETAAAVIADVKSSVSSNGVQVQLADGTPVGSTGSSAAVATEDFSSDPAQRLAFANDIKSGKTPLVLISSRYNNLFGSADLTITDIKKLGEESRTLIGDFGKIQTRSGLMGLATRIDKNTLSKVPDGSLEEIISSIVSGTSFDINAVKVSISGNNVSVQKPESKEINITVQSSLIAAEFRKTAMSSIKSYLDTINSSKQTFYKVLDNIAKLNRNEVDESNTELVETIQLLKEKTQVINGLMKVATLVFHHAINNVKLTADFLESFIYSVALVCEHSLKDK